MSELLLLHWSDLHFAADAHSSGLAPGRAVALAAEAVGRDHPDKSFLLVISGDITTQGRATGYREAAESLRLAKSAVNVSKIVVCPGNHDIGRVDPTSFRDFNRFALRATGDVEQMWDGEHPVRVVLVGDYSIVAVNTAYQGDHNFGSTPLAPLRSALTHAAGTIPIVVMHHSPISGAYAGGGMTDAYELLALVSEYPVAALLHGHVHSDQGLTIGHHGTLLFGAGSLGFEPDPNMNNQFVIHKLLDDVVAESIIYRYYRNRDRFEGGH